MIHGIPLCNLSVCEWPLLADVDLNKILSTIFPYSGGSGWLSHPVPGLLLHDSSTIERIAPVAFLGRP
jgi:hypothetical protein